MDVLPQSILLCSQMIGILPLKMARTSKNIRVMEFSLKVFIWQLVLFCFRCITVIVVFCYDITHFVFDEPSIITSTETLLTRFCKLVLLETVGFVSLFSGTKNHSTIIEMCQILDSFDADLGLKLKVGNKPTMYCILLFIISSITIGLRIAKYSRENLVGLLYTPQYLIYFIQIDVFLQFTSLAEGLKKRFRIINQKIRNVAMGVRPIKKQTNNAALKDYMSNNDQIRMLIEAYDNLFEAVRKANSFYSSHLLATILCSGVHVLVSVYFSIVWWSASSIFRTLNESIWAAAFAVYLVMLVLAGSSVIEEADLTAPMVAEMLSTDLLDPRIKKELRTFLLQLLHYKVKFSALGFLQVRRELLTSLASAGTTYLVIMIQFQNQE